jgi:alpha-D-ribose 1-methylphosphonate 5-triphosphate synthase subunit PhnG
MNASRLDNCAEDVSSRQRLMRACVTASEAELEAAIAGLGEPPAYRELRAAETGLVMLRGRIGGTGSPFNVGEVTVTRAALRLASGAIGFAYLLGRSHRRATLAALIDALGQDADCRTGWKRSSSNPSLRVAPPRMHA